MEGSPPTHERLGDPAQAEEAAQVRSGRRALAVPADVTRPEFRLAEGWRRRRGPTG